MSIAQTAMHGKQLVSCFRLRQKRTLKRLNAMLHRLRQVRSVIRLEPFDASSAEGMSKERCRRIALTTVTSALAKGVGLATMLISVPLTVNYLGAERFGLWMTISSLIAVLGF